MKNTILIFILIVVSTLFSALAQAETVSLAWDANSEDNLAGYKLYYKTDTSGAPYDGTGADQGDSPVTIDLSVLEDAAVPFYTLTGLGYGTYYFALTAFDTDGLESDYSDEVFTTLTEPDGGGSTADPPKAPTGLEVWE